ncbi:hypothetical protein DEU56DRAFT_349763 [Suillus clintonianus]|uniref:uncharacterized protein n=1 Tax=Suillus clintonianus TaxID=1904413 RepID=UPI001B874272|nr:uncharacterized protein DEU56DRAFT_349763 [Suillus clintonianus]KAG2137488.1 hypothetical protein DEU56DRAFT_349763 [Suillus clintonianus]
MRIPISITVLCTLVAYTTAQCMECALNVTYSSVNYTLKEQCTVHSGYHCFYRGDDAEGSFCDCYYNTAGIIETNESTFFCPTGSTNFNAACSGCPS